MEKTWSTLYKKNTSGSHQEWTISVKDNVITKVYGQVGGKLQTVTDTISEGKNEGKANATTASEQAVKEAEAQWTLKQKKRYVISMSDATEGKVSAEHITGGINPMLAHSYADKAKHIEFPCHVQPKLDGIRCIAIIKEGKATLWTRSRKPITSVPHIVKALGAAYKGKQLILDGELYNHSYKDKFEEIISFVNQVEPKDGHEVVQYHIYDIVNYEMPFTNRAFTLKGYRQKLEKDSPLKIVADSIAVDDDSVQRFLELYLEQGYEGCIIRNSSSLYEGIRSNGLQKLKKFDDAEFEVTDVNEGRGRMAGKAIFVCKTEAGNTFKAKMEGSLDKLTEILTNKKDYIGKKLTVRYQGFTNGNVPRFPVGVSIRDYE